MPTSPFLILQRPFTTKTAHAASTLQILQPDLLTILQCLYQFLPLLAAQLAVRRVLALFPLLMTEPSRPELVARAGIAVEV